MTARLSDHDAAIWRTIWINELIDAGRFAEVETVSTPFPPSLAYSERMVAVGSYRLNEFLPLGDGSYVHDNSVFWATGRYGAAMTVGAAVGRALGNSARRRAAEAAAVPRWRPVDQGYLYVSDWGFYLQSAQGLRPWAWDAVTSAQLAGPTLVHLTGNSTTGPVQWVVESYWSELLFSLWARARHQQHPQLLGAVWVPRGWAQRLAASGYDAPPNLTRRWRAITATRDSE